MLRLCRNPQGQNAYNIAAPHSNITIRQLAEMTAKIGNKQVVFDLPTQEESKGYNPVKHSIHAVEKLSALGWTVQGSIFEKMQKTIEAHNE